MSKEEESIWPVDEGRQKIELQIRILDYLISEAEAIMNGLLIAIESLESSLKDSPNLLAVELKDLEKPLALKQPLQQAVERLKSEIGKINTVIEDYRKQKTELRSQLDKPSSIN